MRRLRLAARIAPGVLAVACGDSSASAPGGTITVTGVVVDEFGWVQREAHVLIVGHAPVYADENGRFTVRGVRRPYDLATGLLFERAAFLYKGLTRADPTVVVPSDFPPSPNSATHTGVITGGGGLTQPANHRASVLLESAATHWEGTVNVDYSYRLAPIWRGQTTTTGTLHALQWRFDPTSRLPVDYTAYGNTTGFTLTSGASGPGPPIPIVSPVSEGLLSGSVVTPAGVSVVAKSLRLGFATSSLHSPALRLLTDSGSANGFSYATPILPGATFSLTVDLVSGLATGRMVRTGFSATATGVTLDAPVLPALISPAEGATDVGSVTQFTWTRTSGAVYMLSLTYIGTARFFPTAPNFYILTTDTSATVPNVSPLGTTAYQGTQYRWEVHAWAPVGSVDAIAVPSWFTPRGDVVFTVSESRTFTTARFR